MTFGQRFRMLRSEKGYNQEELALDFTNKTGKPTNKASISHYETDRRKPEIELLESFATYFDVTIDYLLCRTENRKSTIPEKAVYQDEYEKYFPEGFRMIRRAATDLTDKDKEKLIQIMKAYLDD